MHHHDDRRSDAALVALALAGEGEVFGTLLLRYYASVARLCHRLLGPTSEAQDVAQEAALQAFLGLSTLNEPARFGAWLHAIAANLARMELRRRRTLSLEALQDPSSSSGRGAAMVVLWAAGPPTPEEVHAAREVHDTIVAALSELSVVNREVVIGFYLEGYSYAELAELLGVPVSTVKGRRQLRETLAPTAREVLKPDRRPRKERLMEASELVEVKIESIRSSVLTQSRVVVLSEQGGERLLPIWIGVFEGDAIRLALEGYQPQRPMTHDLALRLITPLGAQVQHVVVNKLAETTFYAQITLAVDGQVHEIDARPSDAIALAVRAGAPIYVARSVFDTAGTTRLEERLKQDEQHVAAELAASARPGENTWVLLFESRTETGPSNVFPVLHFTSADWPGTSYQRELEWEGRKMMAVQLPGANENAAWLIVDPAFWERTAGAVWKFAQRPEPQPPEGEEKKSA